MKKSWTNPIKTSKTIFFTLTCLFMSLSGYTQDRTSLVLWNFNQSDRPQGNAPWASSIPANEGEAEISYTFSNEGDRPVTSFSGSEEDLTGFSVSQSGGSFVPQGDKENGNHFQFSIDARGFQNLTLSYATRGTSSGFQTQTWFVSENGAEWVQVSEFSGITSEYELRTIDLSDYGFIENLGIRCVVDGASSNTGNNRFDNIRVTGEIETVTLQFSTDQISFDTPTNLNSFSAPEALNISSISTSAVLEISATEYFEVAKTIDGAYSNSVRYEPEETANDFVVYIRFAAPAQSIGGNVGGNLFFNLSPSQSVQLSAQLAGQSVGLPYTENFDNSNFFVLPDWQRFQEVGEQNWMVTEENRYAENPYSVRMNGFSGGAQENRTWLISPPVALDALEANQFLIMEFESRSFFADGTPLLRVFASTDYDRSAAPTDAQFNWVEISTSLPLETGIWQSTGETNLTSLVADSISIAIIYESVAAENGAAEWMVDNFQLYASDQIPVPIISISDWSLKDYHYGILAPGQSSEARTITIAASNLSSSITLTPDPGIELALGNDFTSQLTITEEDFPASGVLDINTRMTASSDASVLAQAGNITLSTEGLADTTFGYFNHTTIGKDETFDVVTWNVEWFGDPANATTPNTDLQRRRVRDLIQDLDADVYAFQEITSVTAWNTIVAELQEYGGVLSPAFSRPAGDFESAQKLGFLFKRATVDTIRTRVLFENLDTEDLVDYPVTNQSLFWASGRLPFAMEIKATIGNIERELMLVNIHARSNGGGESESLPRYQLRRYDVEVLYDSLQEYYQDKSLILLGDYNDDILRTVSPVSEPTVPENGESSYTKFISDSDNYLGVSMPLSEAGMRSFVSLPSMIDHIMINQQMFEDHIIGAERVVVPYATVPDYNNTTSDHFPVEARFLLSGETIVSLEQDVEASSALIYPNPSEGVIHFSGFDRVQSVQVYSSIGERLAKYEGDLKSIDLSHLDAGVYLLLINSAKGQGVKRVVISK